MSLRRLGDRKALRLQSWVYSHLLLGSAFWGRLCKGEGKEELMSSATSQGTTNERAILEVDVGPVNP